MRPSTLIGGLTATKGTLYILPLKILCAIGQIPYLRVQADLEARSAHGTRSRLSHRLLRAELLRAERQVSAVRSSAPSLCIEAEMWRRTVTDEMPRRSAMAVVELPRRNKSSTWFSRVVRQSPPEAAR